MAIINTEENYRLHQEGEVKWVTFPELDAYPELVHAFTTRHGGVSTGEKTSLNFGKGPDETWDNILENYRILAAALSEEAGKAGFVNREHMVRTDQTHTANVLTVTEEHLSMGILREREYTNIDGLITNKRGLTLITSHADCNALFFYDPKQQAIGLAHSGWKGTLQEIGAQIIRQMSTEFDTQPEDLIVGIGPALCQTCFEVDEDVAQKFYQKNPAWKTMAFQREIGICSETGEERRKHYIDLKSVVRETLMRSGVKSENIHDMGLCSKCRPDLFYSYRGQKGKNGNMVSVMMLRP
ncbi:MAG: peptidoglycan editing factor PgeF [Firmicutes bacterium]|nr:peptidoglycan editing factor PgeF [Bacillota bacterium]